MVARFAIKSGQVALYHVPTPTSTDDGPLTNPLAHLDRVIVHPALRIPGVIRTITGTLSLPALTNGSYATIRTTHVLGAHGESGRPMIIGRILGIGVGGASVPWVGSVPVQSYAFAGGGTPYIIARGGTRWLTLGVNGGNIVAYQNVLGYNVTNPAISIDYEVHVLSRDLSAALPNSGPTRARINGTSFVIETPGGTISSEHKYVKAAASGGFALSGGRTCRLRYNRTLGSSIINYTTARWSVGAGIFERDFRYYYNSFDGYVDLQASAVSPVIQQANL